MDLKEFIEEFVDQFDDTDASEIQADTEYHELDEWSSMIALSVLNVIGKKYGCTLTFEDLKKSVTVEDLFNLVVSKVSKV